MNGLIRILTTCQSKGNGVIFTDTYFYTKLMQLRKDDPKNQGKFNYQEVKEQCKNAMKKYGVTFLESKAVYIPIHLDEQHWICSVIMKKTNELIIYNDFGIKETSTTALLTQRQQMGTDQDGISDKGTSTDCVAQQQQMATDQGMESLTKGPQRQPYKCDDDKWGRATMTNGDGLGWRISDEGTSTDCVAQRRQMETN